MFLSACLWRQAIINFSFEQIIWVFWLVWQTETSSLPISSCVSRQTTVWFHIFAQVIFCNIDKVKRKQVGTVKYFFLFSPPDRFVCLRTLKLYHEFKELWVWQFFSTILLGCWVQVKIYKKSNKYQHLNQYLNISGIITRLGENRDCKNPASITQGAMTHRSTARKICIHENILIPGYGNPRYRSFWISQYNSISLNDEAG